MNPYEVFVRLAVFIGSGLAIAGCRTDLKDYPTVPGEVIEYRERAAWMQPLVTSNGKTTSVSYIYHPANAAVWIRTDLGTTSFSVEYGSQWRWPQGQPVRVYVKPRFMGFYRVDEKRW